MKTVIRNNYSPKTGDYCETIVVDKETESAYIFDCDGVFTPMPQPVDVEEILRLAAEYTDETVAPINEKLDTIEEGAQVNTIEHVLKNGTELTITNKTVNVTVPTKTSELTNDGSDGTDTYVETAALSDYYTKSETDTQIGYETSAREIADQGLQEQIDAIVASSDVVDIVGTYAALQAYDTSKLHDNDIIKVLTDETRDDATTYYRWDSDTSTWGYIGAEGPFYTKAESDATFVPQTRTVNNKALSGDITLTASDVGALPDSTVIPTVNDATLTIQKNGTAVQTFTANQSSDAVANITVPTDTSDLTNGAGFITSAALPTKTSDLTNDGSDGTSTYVEADDMPTKTSDFTNDGSDGTSTYVEADELAAVATTGDYGDLLNTPTIPTVNDATLTIQKNGVDVASFTANSATGATANITVPTDTSDLTNGAGFITTSALSNYYTKSETYSQQEVNSLINTITIPTKTSDLTNDGSDGSSTYVEADDLATVATTGDYDDLLNKPTIPTIVDMTGATTSTAGAHGYVPAPAAGDEDKYLKGDGTWSTVQSGDTATTFWIGNNYSALYSDSQRTNIVTGGEFIDAVVRGPVIITENGDDIKYYGTAYYKYSTPGYILLCCGGIAATRDGNMEYMHVETRGTNSTNMVIFSGRLQGMLTAGTNITIGNNNTISASIPIDSALDVSSTNPVENSVVTAALNGKQGTLTAGSNIQINNGVISATDTTYSDFVGTDGQTAGTHGLVPAPATTDAGEYLKADGTWDTPPGVTYTAGTGIDITGTTLSVDTSVIAELSDLPTKTSDLTNDGSDGTSTYVEADDLATVATTGDYDDLIDKPTIPTVNDATLTITQNGTSAGTFTANASSNATIALTDTTYSDFVGATSSVAGSAGLVPAPTTSDTDKVLHGDGTWKDTTAKLVEMSYGESNAWAKFIAAYNAGSIVYCRASSNANPGSGSQTRKAFMAYVNNATSPTNVEFQYVRSQSSKSDSQQCDQVFVYKLTNSNGGTWSVESRDMATKINVDSTLNKTYNSGANASMTLGAKTMTGATSSAAGTAGIVPAPSAGDDTKFLAGDGTWKTAGGGSAYTAGNGIDIMNDVISIDDTVVAELSDIPTVNDATLTIQHNGTNVQTFTANQSTNATANIETIYATTVQPVSQVAPIATAQIQDEAVTAAKVDWSTVLERHTFTYTLDSTGNANTGINTADYWVVAVNQTGSGTYLNGNIVPYAWSDGKYYIHVDQNYGHAYSTGSITVEMLLLKRSAIGF